MWRNPQRTVALIHWLLGWTFAVVGLLFLLFPDGTVQTINAVGAILRVFPPAPASDLRFWLSLSFAYMVLVTVLAFRIAADPRSQRTLMPVLAAGKFASSITCLYFFAVHQAAFLYLLNFFVDGSIAAVVLGCFLWLAVADWSAEAEPRGHVQHLLRLVTETMIPEGGAFAPGAASLQLDNTVWRYFAGMHRLGTLGLTAILYAIEFGPYIFGPRRRRFSQLGSTERETYLAGWETSKLALRRQLLHALKLVHVLHFYANPEAEAAVGCDGSYLRAKLLAGPNAAFHRARLT